jgi:hypothetical protein
MLLQDELIMLENRFKAAITVGEKHHYAQRIRSLTGYVPHDIQIVIAGREIKKNPALLPMPDDFDFCD